jgi:4-hydroxy-3-methylbut-2-enyl diphosphate reductase
LEAAKIAAEVDAMLVVGDKHSSNTQKLYEICKNACENTYLLQTYRDLNVLLLHPYETIGITAGASTPNIIIEEVSNNVRNRL